MCLPLLSLRGEAEAIHNLIYRKHCNKILKEVQDYRLPRFHKWNLAMILYVIIDLR
ncbi:hypothetical protein [Helicobacter rodentium]|uniref:hypothetical protein n=1 Tax=Helicobacter rodentium TaxID=59617 RepID=UPI0023F05435|nr:hypothetical protein [Helicobacter rodentium]